jgi:hypothetical protein
MYSTLVGRLPPDGLHLGEGIEMSHGPLFYSRLLERFGHTHAQCLATLLQIICKLSLLNPDPKTKTTETIMDYFDRATRIAREAREFPAMKVPIAGPLLKVMILQGLVASDKDKYGAMVLNEYASDLKSSFDKLRNTMQTVEGLREQAILDQYAPSSLAEASVQVAGADGPCPTPGHKNHTVGECGQPCKLGVRHKHHTSGQCRTLNGNNGGGRTESQNATYTYKGEKGLCRLYTSSGTCRYGSRCKYKHDKSIARAHLTEALGDEETTAVGKLASAESDDDDENPFEMMEDPEDNESSSDEERYFQ